MEYENAKVFVKSICNIEPLKKDQYYEVIQMIQYKEQKYFAIDMGNNKIETIPIINFDRK